jgi:hypothetical protein
MGSFKIKPLAFQTTKQRFDVPTAAVVIQSRFGMMRRHQHEIIVREANANDKQGHTPYPTGTRQDTHLSDWGISEIGRCRECSGTTQSRNLRIMANANAKQKMLFLEKLDPVFADEFTVSGDTVDTGFPELQENAFQERDPFHRIRIAAFVKECPEQRDGNPVIRDR